MGQHTLNPRELTPHERDLLDTLAAQKKPVTQLALAAWHLDGDADFDDLQAAFDVVDQLHADGYLTVVGDHVTLNDDQRSICGMQLGELAEVDRRLLAVLAASSRPLRAGAVAVLAAEAADTHAGFAALFPPMQQQMIQTAGPAYPTAIRLKNLRDARCCTLTVNRSASTEYWMTAGQKAFFRYRYTPAPLPAPVPIPASPYGRAGRAVDLDGP